MRKILSILFLTASILFSYTIDGRGQEAAASTSNKQTSYSESRPYEPRRFVEPGKLKPNKLKKKSDQPKVSSTNDKTDLLSEQILKIPVVVYDKSGKPLKDLKAEDFKVFADNTEQEIVSIESPKTKRNFMVVIDTSPSFSYSDDNLKRFVGEMVKALKSDDTMQLVRFNQQPEILNEPTNDTKILQKAIKRLKMGDGTSLYDSMQIIYRKYLVSATEKPIIILITDGVDTTSQRSDYYSSLIIAEENDAVVYPLYYDTYQDFQSRQSRITFPVPGLPYPRRSSQLEKDEYTLGRYYLEDLAELSGGKTYSIEKFSEIKQQDFENLFEIISPIYYLSIKQPANEQAGQRKQLKVRVNRPNLNIQARGSYIAGAN